MVISAECLVAQANACLSKELRMCEVAQLVGLNTNLNAVPYTVACVALLPDATCNTGRFVYVSNICDYRFSDGASWSREFVSAIPVNNALAWGYGNVGQLGNSCSGISNPPIQRSPMVPSGGYDQTWCNISAGVGATAAVKANGTAWTWGYGQFGQLGNCCTANRSSPGTVLGVGNTWCQISSGFWQTAAIKTDGTAWTWGLNSSGQLGDGTVANRSSPVALTGANTCWRQISAGAAHTAAIKYCGTDWTAWTWGLNNCGQLGDGTVVDRSSPDTTSGGGTTWCQIAAGNQQTAAIKTDSTAWTWGRNNAGQLGDNTTVNKSSPVQPAGGGTTWCQISAGDGHTAAIKYDGIAWTAWTWGRNYRGQLGDGTVVFRSSPVQPAGGGTTWCQISVNCEHTAAVKTDGTAWTWGWNITGQLGDGTMLNRCSPGLVSGDLNTWCSISAGNLHTVGLIT